VHRNPSAPTTWARIYSQSGVHGGVSPVQLAATGTGLSGVGKSTAIERALNLYPQVFTHDRFPGMATPVQQLLWLKVDVPATGKVADFVESLCMATDDALNATFTRDIFSGRRLHGATLAQRWLQKISCNFLGILVIDEAQNLFKIERKSVRSSPSRRTASARPPLRIVDDETLKLLLTLSNNSRIPTVVSSTPDGVEALNTRMSTSQRLVTAGFHRIPHFASAEDDFFRKRLFPILWEYQWLPQKLEATDGARRLLHELSGGIPRICMSLWVHAHRQAFQRDGSQLREDDFRRAAELALSPLRPAVQALLSGDVRRLSEYEDLAASGWEAGVG